MTSGNGDTGPRWTLEIGDSLRDKYVIRDILGAGGFGVTYLAEDETLGKLFAVKEFFPEEFVMREGRTVRPKTNGEANYQWGLKRFLDEARTLARFHHPNIVSISEYFEANDTAYMVLTYERGKSLRDWLKALGRPPTQAQLDGMLVRLLDALELMHDNKVLHRDIAPDNVLIRDDSSPVLLDFGSAREAISQRSRNVSAIIKAGYSPQEQYSTKGSGQGAWTDIYALAATFYEAVTGKAPPEAPERVLRDDYVPAAEAAAKAGRKRYRPEFLEAIDWALKLMPGERPQTVAEWRERLLTGSGEKSAAVEHGTVDPEPVPRPPRLRPIVWAAAAVLLLLLGAGGGGYVAYTQGLLDGVDLSFLGPLDPNAPPSAAAIAEAEKKFKALNLSRDDRLRIARALYHQGYTKEAQPNPQFVDYGNLPPAYRETIKLFQKDKRLPATGYVTERELALLRPLGDKLTPWEEEQAREAERLRKERERQEAERRRREEAEQEARRLREQEEERRQREANAPRLEICNRSQSNDIRVSVAYRQSGDWLSKGWYKLEKDKCSILVRGADVDKQFYLYATDSIRGGAWTGTHNFCLHETNAFEVRGRDNCSGRGYVSVGFLEFQASSSNKLTVDVTEGGRLIWGAVYKKGQDSFYGRYGENGEDKAKDGARANCQKANVRGRCEFQVTFANCFALARAPRGGWGWATRPTMPEARTAALSSCREKNRSCRLSWGFCADGSNEFNNK